MEKIIQIMGDTILKENDYSTEAVQILLRFSRLYAWRCSRRSTDLSTKVHGETLQ